MDINKSSESVITITVSVSVELRVLLDEGTQSFAEKCREALEEELTPILGIGRPMAGVAPPPGSPPDTEARRPTEYVAPRDTSHLTPVVVNGVTLDEAGNVRGLQENNPPNRDNANVDNVEAQIPPSERRGRR